IEDRVGTFEVEPRSADEVGDWIEAAYPIVVSEDEAGQIVAWASAPPYRPHRPAYSGVAELSIYVARPARGQVAGRETLPALSSCKRGNPYVGLSALPAAVSDTGDSGDLGQVRPDAPPEPPLPWPVGRAAQGRRHRAAPGRRLRFACARPARRAHSRPHVREAGPVHAARAGRNQRPDRAEAGRVLVAPARALERADPGDREADRNRAAALRRGHHRGRQRRRHGDWRPARRDADAERRPRPRPAQRED